MQIREVRLRYTIELLAEFCRQHEFRSLQVGGALCLGACADDHSCNLIAPQQPCECDQGRRRVECTGNDAEFLDDRVNLARVDR